MNDRTRARVWDEAARQWVRAHGAAPDRPWLVWLDGDLYGDFRTQPEQLAAVTEAAASGGEVSTSHWDPEGYTGPGWTEPVIACQAPSARWYPCPDFPDNLQIGVPDRTAEPRRVRTPENTVTRCPATSQPAAVIASGAPPRRGTPAAAAPSRAAPAQDAPVRAAADRASPARQAQRSFPRAPLPGPAPGSEPAAARPAESGPSVKPPKP